MTRIVAALEDLGHVTRVVDPADRRVARVTLTDVRARGAPAQPLAQERLPGRPAARASTPEERAALGELTVLLERLVDQDEP